MALQNTADDERKPLLDRPENDPSPKLFSPAVRLLIAGLIVSASLGVTQVPYVRPGYSHRTRPIERGHHIYPEDPMESELFRWPPRQIG
jgi:hypothetical protein